VVALALALLNPGTPSQYDLVLNYGFSDHELRLYHLNPDDSLTLLDVTPLDPSVDTPTNRLLVSPRGDWMIAPFVSPTSTIQLVSILPSGELVLEEHLNENLHSQLITSLRPDGAGFFTSTVEVFATPPTYRQFFFVNPDFTITPVNASQEYMSPEERLRNTVITHRGIFTVIGQEANTHRTYHLDPDGALGPISPPMLYEENNLQYTGRALGVSRDGHLVISGGNGSLTQAVSMWVDDAGTVSIIDKIRLPDGQRLAGGGDTESVLISPYRDWVIFQGDATELWDLNPDGSFAGKRWTVTQTGIFGTADLSPDARVVIVNHLVFTDWTLSILRLSPTGDVESIAQHVFDLPIYPAVFIPRRRPGDCNGDGWLDATDVVCLVNHITQGIEIPNPVDFDHADVDRDGDRDQSDVSALVDLILGQTP
jgi:hypothetical protein